MKLTFIKGLGLLLFVELTKKWNLEVQLFASDTRSFKDGITFFNFKFNWDRYVSEHTPAIQIELTLFNMYNHIWINQYNFEENEQSYTTTPE